MFPIIKQQMYMNWKVYLDLALTTEDVSGGSGDFALMRMVCLVELKQMKNKYN